MRTLIEKSIKFKGIGRPELITEFNVESEADKYSRDFRSLTTISGRLITVLFDVTENDEVNNMTTQIQVVKSDDAAEIKKQITDHINSII